VSAVYPPGRHLTPKVRAFVDFLASQCLARQGA
jgi:DNA-binding transcriptional LysR family regulator